MYYAGLLAFVNLIILITLLVLIIYTLVNVNKALIIWIKNNEHKDI